MVFGEYIKSLSPERRTSERREMIKKIAEVTCKSDVAVYAWINGEREPDMLTKKAISGLLNIPVEELFPEGNR